MDGDEKYIEETNGSACAVFIYLGKDIIMSQVAEYKEEAKKNNLDYCDIKIEYGGRKRRMSFDEFEKAIFRGE